MNGNGSPTLAQRTCSQCKASKKKCDKLLPKCTRCLRLAIDCTYSEPERQNGSDLGPDAADPRFEEVFRRLERIESRLFTASVGREEHGVPERLPSTRDERRAIGELSPENATFNPETLKPHNMRLLLYRSVSRALTEHDITIETIAHKYFEHTHMWLPMIPRAKFDKQRALFETMKADTSFLLHLSAMHLVVTPYTEHPPATSLQESAWYVACKSFFAQYVALSEPCIELVQAGILIALFECLQCIGDRALTTLGICSRMAYMLELDEVVAEQANCNPGEMSPENEEVVLTYWGLSQLDRYFNMPPLPIPRQPSISHQPLNETPANYGCGFRGPPTTDFKTIDTEMLDHCIMEVEASHKLRRVQAFIRDNRHQTAASISDGIQLLLREIRDHLIILRIRLRQSGSWAGIAVTLGAGLQLQYFFVEKQGFLAPDVMMSLHSYIEQMRDVVAQCRVFNGFTENYLEGIQPTWSTIPYLAMKAYKMIRETDTQRTLAEIDLSVLLEAMQSMATRYKLAEKCLELLELP